MGEYATFRGQSVKIGTCEDLYYLRFDQVGEVLPEDGSLDPWAEREVIRFRFPWPDEDGNEPGTYGNHDRGLSLYGVEAPAELADEHYKVQFVASAGYNVCLPCPESGKTLEGAHVHRNGFSGPVKLVQQGWRDGKLVGMMQCGGCGLTYRLPTLEDAQPVLDAIEVLAEREDQTARLNDTPGNAAVAERYREIARRLRAGYDYQ